MGPLAGIRIVELAGIGPGPMCAMLLADLGAEVILVERTGESGLGLPLKRKFAVTSRGRKSIALDLKKPEAIEAVLRLIAKSDGLIEGFRPGVMERLGLGPDVCMARNPKLVYGRMTGFGQQGPLAHAAGHDINYISLTGALHAMGRKGDRPVPPLNLVGDFGGGALYLAFGMMAAMLRAQKTGEGDVVDAAMVDGAASLMAMFFGLSAAGRWTDNRGENILDTGAPWYDVYETKDGKYFAVGAIETKFFAVLADRIGLTEEDRKRQYDVTYWPILKARITDIMRTKTRDEWSAILEGSDACATPVLSIAEAPNHPHMAARRTFETRAGVVQPASAPRFARAGAPAVSPPPEIGAQTKDLLALAGYSDAEVAAMLTSGVAV
jgi:alpha-methylacyl-CoA racemase